MFKSILVPTDGTYLSDIATSKAVEFAKLNPGSRIIALAVAEPIPTIAYEAEAFTNVETYLGRARVNAQSYADKVAAEAGKAGIPCETVVKESHRPYEEIISTAKEKGCDCIFMSSHGRKGYNELVLGSNTHKVLTQSHIPVMVFRPQLIPDKGKGAQWDLMGF